MRQLYNIEAENALLGSAFFSKEKVQQLLERTVETDYFSPQNMEIFKAVKKLTLNNQPVDAVSVADITDDLNHAIDVSSNSYLSASFDHHLKIVLNYAKERELYQLGQEINETLFSDEDMTTQDRLEAIQKAYTALSSERVPSTIVTIKDAVKELVDHLEWKNNNPDQTGIGTGIVHYDQRINGYLGGQMVVIAGTPGAGKTTLGMQAIRKACDEGKRAMVFSLEMPKRQLAQRMMAASHSIPLGMIIDGSVSHNTEQSVKLAPAAVAAAKLDMVIDDQGGIDIADIKTRARAAHREKKLDVILIDYLQLVNDRSNKERLQVVSNVSREIKALAKELDCPIIALSQLNRAIMSRTDKRPQLSDLRESGQIEQDADIITFVYREASFDDQCSNQTGVEMITRKFRDGEAGTDYAEFEGMFNRFVNTQWRPAPPEQKQKGGFQL